MKKILTSLCMTGILAAGNINSVFAEDIKKEAVLPPAVIEQMDVANKLIALGDARKDPLLLIAAAKLQKNLGAEAASTPTQSGATADVLDRAKKLSAGRKDLIGIADDVAAAKSKSGEYRGYTSSEVSRGYGSGTYYVGH